MTPRRPFDEQQDAWVLETAQRALGYAVTLTRSREDAEDIVHDCYQRLLAKRDDYDLPRDGTKLLFRSITNACINCSQRQRNDLSLSDGERRGGSLAKGSVDPRAADPVQVAICHELEAAVEQAMQELPVGQRAAVELRSLGHTSVEVAEILDISHANARVTLHRAREFLAAKLRPFLENHS